MVDNFKILPLAQWLVKRLMILPPLTRPRLPLQMKWTRRRPNPEAFSPVLVFQAGQPSSTLQNHRQDGVAEEWWLGGAHPNQDDQDTAYWSEGL
jgi:hypothetical protein